MGIFHILHEKHILNKEVVVVQTTELKFKASIATNVIFERQGKIFAQFGSKMTKLIIFKNFTLVSLEIKKLVII